MTLPLVWLADAIRAEGATVEELPGWKTYTKSGVFTPVGLIDHHTAGSSILVNYPNPPFWKPARLQPVCNITIQPDGIVWTLNAGRAWDSGNGDKHVLAAVKADEPASRPTDTYVRNSVGKLVPGGPNPGISGNQWFIDIEVQHRGDGGPIAAAQYEALIQTNAAILSHEGWGENQLIGHRGWSRRKIDPKWNGNSDPMPQIRADTNERLGQGDGDMDQVGKAVVDIAFDMGWASGDRTYWYGKDNNDPELEDLRAAIREGAAADRVKIDEGGGGGSHDHPFGGTTEASG